MDAQVGDRGPAADGGGAGGGAPGPEPAGHQRPADEVDRIVDAWRRLRPDLDVAPLAVLSRVTRLARHLDLARRRAFARHGLETWEFDVLSALRRAGERYELSPSALLTQTLVTSGTMTNRVDRLAARGLVLRVPDRADRRGVLVRLTGEGLALVDGAMADLLAVERDLLEPVEEADRELLAELLHDLLARFEVTDRGRPPLSRGR